MVRLFENRIGVLIEVLIAMASVDDPYVLERLYAVAYGCAMRTVDNDSLKLLADKIFYLVFESENPPPHILMRDYARGVIEVAIHRGCSLHLDLEKIRPPYKSDWPPSQCLPRNNFRSGAKHGTECPIPSSPGCNFITL